MLCTLLISSNESTISHFQSLALEYGCILKVVESEEECYEFPADTPFTGIFLDCESLDSKFLNATEIVKRRFAKSKIYLFSLKSGNYNIDNLKQINTLKEVNKIFDSLFGSYYKRPTEILSCLRACQLTNIGDIFSEKHLIAIYPNTTDIVDKKIISSFPVELLPDRIDIFTNGTTVYAFIDSTVNNINRICYNIIIELHNLNISAFAVFSDTISSFESACQLFAEMNSYAVKLRLDKNYADVNYFNNDVRLLEPFGNIIKQAQSTGFKIRVSKNDENIVSLLDDFFNQSQLCGATPFNLQFLVCEIIRSAFDDDVLYDNLFAIISSKSINELKSIIMGAFAKEKISQGDLEVMGNERIIRQICDIIENEYATELYLDRVAEQIYLSPAYISRIFKKSTGMNFVKYLNEVRLKKAAALLLEADFPINEISKRVGFSDVSYFCSCFKKKYGMTTVQYRRAYVLKEIEV